MDLRRATVVSSALLGLLLAAPFLWKSEPRPDPDPSESEEPRGSRELVVSGVFYEEVEANRPILTLTADEVLREKRRFGAFSLNPFRELVVRHARISIDIDLGSADPPAPEQLGRRIFEAISVSGAGLVTRIRVDRLELEASAGGVPVLLVAASEARISRRSHHFDLRGGLSVLSGSGQRLRAASARWLGDGWGFAIRGSYELTQPDGPTERGAGGVFSVDGAGSLRRLPADA